jgi:hypothetical protein
MRISIIFEDFLENWRLFRGFFSGIEAFSKRCEAFFEMFLWLLLIILPRRLFGRRPPLLITRITAI